MKRLQMYCDGGCRGNHEKNNIGAWGVFLQYNGKEKELKGAVKNTTNNQMELLAVINGLKALKKDCPMDIYLDSAYVLNGITSWIDGWKRKGWVNSSKQPVKNKKLWIELDEQRNKFTDVKWHKVKGHSDNYGNIQADRLCNEAMDRWCLHETCK